MNTEQKSNMQCPVCEGIGIRHFAREDGRDYFCCGDCSAVFAHPEQMPAAADEKARYEKHRNDPDDSGYKRFLERVARPLLARLAPGRAGLDYGCGPGPVLAGMLREAGHDVALYDPFFHPDDAALARRYDFITCTETAEHFHRPAVEFARLDSLLAPGGLLAVMTCFLSDDIDFSRWHYRQDFTHVVFYRAETFEFIAAHFGWRCDIPEKDIVLLQKDSGLKRC